MSNWSDKIVVIGVGVSKEDTEKIKEIIIEKIDNQPQLWYTGLIPREGKKMPKFAIKYEIEVVVEAEIANEAWKKAGKVFESFDYRGLHCVNYLKKVSTKELGAK